MQVADNHRRTKQPHYKTFELSAGFLIETVLCKQSKQSGRQRTAPVPNGPRDEAEAEIGFGELDDALHMVWDCFAGSMQRQLLLNLTLKDEIVSRSSEALVPGLVPLADLAGSAQDIALRWHLDDQPGVDRDGRRHGAACRWRQADTDRSSSNPLLPDIVCC